MSIFIISGAYIHFRGRVRHSFGRQLTSHTNLTAPYNAFVYLRSGVPNTPFLSTKDFPELDILRDNWEIIRDEALAAYQQGKVKTSDQYDDVSFNSFFKTGWSRYYLKWYDDYLPSARRECPRTVELLEKTPSVNAALIALLPPGAHLTIHRDPFAGSLRYHLGLQTPNSPDCYIDVDGERYSWADGEGVLFDETYIHAARNDTDVNRFILFCDVQRPMRDRLSERINRWVSRHVIKATTTRNEPGEKVGLLNRAFQHVYKIRIAGKKLKQWNKLGYYIIKYAVFAGLIWLIFF